MKDDTAAGPTWSPDQLGVFIDHVREDRLLALWLLVATTGLDVRTLVTLGRDEVDLHERRIDPRSRPKALSQGQPAASPGYALDPDAYDALKVHVIEWDKTHGEGPGVSGLFLDDNGSALSANKFTSLFRRHCAQANLPVVPFRAVRQAYVIAAIETGIPTRVLRERLGDFTPPTIDQEGERTRRAEPKRQTSDPPLPHRGPRADETARHLRSIR